MKRAQKIQTMKAWAILDGKKIMCCDERAEIYWLKKIAHDTAKEAGIADIADVVRVTISWAKP